MDWKDVMAGEHYLVKVSGRLSPVRVDFRHPITNKFICTNLATGRRILCTAQRIQGPISEEEAQRMANSLTRKKRR